MIPRLHAAHAHFCTPRAGGPAVRFHVSGGGCHQAQSRWLTAVRPSLDGGTCRPPKPRRRLSGSSSAASAPRLGLCISRLVLPAAASSAELPALFINMHIALLHLQNGARAPLEALPAARSPTNVLIALLCLALRPLQQWAEAHAARRHVTAARKHPASPVRWSRFVAGGQGAGRGGPRCAGCRHRRRGVRARSLLLRRSTGSSSTQPARSPLGRLAWSLSGGAFVF